MEENMKWGRCAVVLGGLLLLTLSPTAFQGGENNPAPEEDTRILPEDLVYLGAFRLPDVMGEHEFSWAWSGEALAFCPVGDPYGEEDGHPGSLFATGHNWNQHVSEISIPLPVISEFKDILQLNMASTLQPFQDIRGDMFGELEIPRAGLAYLPRLGAQTSAKLYFCWGQHMQDGETGPSHGWCDLNLSLPQTAGPWAVSNYWNYVTNDYLFPISKEWADLYTPGMNLATGRFRDGGQGARGPSLLSIGPWNLGNPPPAGSILPAIPLLLYTSVTEENDFTLDNYHHSDEWSGGAWLTAGDKSAVVFVGTKGWGDCWYGFADGTIWPDQPPYPPVPDPPYNDRGWWSTGFEAQIIFYDTEDLAAVARGEMQPWEPQPYGVKSIENVLYHIQSSRQKYHVGAAAYDPGQRLLYILEPLADNEKPLVHVWQIGKDQPGNDKGSDPRR
jgi:hypothetical protein